MDNIILAFQDLPLARLVQINMIGVEITANPRLESDMNKPILAALVWMLVWMSLAVHARAADWPMYRADAARSGYTPESLPKELSLSWTYRSQHPPAPAWPNRRRLGFDRAYQPVIAGGVLYFGSSADCKVYALDAATGKTRWTFFTDGPVRFAPVVWQDRVFVAGDDGYVYCLAAADGELLWKLCAAGKVDLLLGNDRMISRWPVRGGPVVADGVLYFAAGIWPSEGIFIYAVDPATGKVLWCNDSSGRVEMNQPHQGARAKSGIGCQGYLAADAGALFVSTGRAVPAVFNRLDGKLRYFELQPYGNRGGSDIVAIDGHFFNACLAFPSDERPRSFVVPKTAFGPAVVRGSGLYPVGPQIAAHPDFVFSAGGKSIRALDRLKLWIDKETTTRKGDKTTIKALGKPLWTASLSHDTGAALIVAGDKIVSGGGNRVSLVDIASHEAVWDTEVDGVPLGLAAADGRLYVSTDRGTIYCYGGPGSRPVVVEAKPQVALDNENTVYATAAEEIIRRAGITEGYCLDLACGDGRLSLELARRTKLRICAVDADEVKVQAARRMFDAAGLYGVRVTVHRADPAEVPYPNWFADLVVSGRSVTEGASVVPTKAVGRVQRPCGGILCVGKPGAMSRSVRGPLEGVGSWTHQYANAAGTCCSDDTRLKGPLAMLWFRDTDFLMPNRHGRGPAPLVVDGRMFVEGVNALRAVDIYNGRTLWEFPLKGIAKPYHQGSLIGVATTGSNFCVSGDRVYVRIDNRCLCLDAKTGRKIAELQSPPRPDGKPGTWGYIACEDGVLFGSLANEQHLAKAIIGQPDMSRLLGESVLFFAMDAGTGKLKWTYTPKDSIRHNAIAVGGGRVYLIDRPLAPIEIARLGRHKGWREAKILASSGAKYQSSQQHRHLLEHPYGRLLALDAETGEVLWSTDKEVFGTLLALSLKHDVLLMSYQRSHGWCWLDSELGGRMAGIAARDGARLWDVEVKYVTRPIVNDRAIYAQPSALDLLTGERLPFGLTKRSYSCGIMAGSKRLLVFRSATLGYFDLAGTRRIENYGGIRPGCWINAIPAGGLVLMADAASWCTCSYLNQATIALQPRDDKR